MKQFRTLPFTLAGLFVSLILGVGTFVSFYNYYQLLEFNQVGSALLAVIFVACCAASFGYYSSMGRQAARTWLGFSPLYRFLLIGGCAILASYLLITTTALTVSPETLAFLQPARTLEIKAPSTQNNSSPEIIFYYLSTEAGDIPFDEATYHGWQGADAEAGLRQSGYWLVLSDFSDNSFTWTGKPGDKAQLAFARSPQGGMIEISRNGVTETVDLAYDREARYFHNVRFSVSPFASTKAVLLVEGLTFFAWLLPLCIYVWDRREKLMASLTASVRPTGTQTEAKHSRTRDQKEVLRLCGLLLALMLVALLPRSLSLGQGIVAVDEMHQLTAAKELIQGASSAEVYQRGLYMVTMPVAGFLQMLGISLGAAKLPGVLFNVLAIVPLFLIVDKINRSAAIFSSLLFAFSPWVIGMSRFVREYAYEPFYFYCIILMMIAVIEHLPKGFVVTRDLRRIVNWRSLIQFSALLFAAYYVIFVDRLSTIRIIGLAYLVFCIFLVSRFDLRKNSNRVYLGVVGFPLVALATRYFRARPEFSIYPEVDLYPLSLLFHNPAGQIYFERPAILFALALLVSLGLSAALFRRNFIPAFLSALFLLSAVFFTLFWGRYNAARYFFSLQLWFLPLLGLGFNVLWLLMRDVIGAKPLRSWVTAVLALGLSVNPAQVLEPTRVPEPPDSGFAQVVGYSLYNMQPVESMLLREATAGDVLISERYGYATYAEWRGIPPMEIVPISTHLATEARSEDLLKLIYDQVEANDSGWIVLRYWWQWSALSRVPVQMGDKTLAYVGEIAWQYIWHWKPTTELTP